MQQANFNQSINLFVTHNRPTFQQKPTQYNTLCGAIGSTQSADAPLVGYPVQRTIMTKSNTRHEIQKCLELKQHTNMSQIKNMCNIIYVYS